MYDANTQTFGVPATGVSVVFHVPLTEVRYFPVWFISGMYFCGACLRAPTAQLHDRRLGGCGLRRLQALSPPSIEDFGRHFDHCCVPLSISAHLLVFKDVWEEIHPFGVPETDVAVVLPFRLTLVHYFTVCFILGGGIFVCCVCVHLSPASYSLPGCRGLRRLHAPLGSQLERFGLGPRSEVSVASIGFLIWTLLGDFLIIVASRLRFCTQGAINKRPSHTKHIATAWGALSAMPAGFICSPN